MKVKAFKTYQAVEFGRSLHTFFSERPGFEGVVMEAGQYGIRVNMNGDHAIVPYNNVAYFKLVEPNADSSAKTAKSEAKKA